MSIGSLLKETCHVDRPAVSRSSIGSSSDTYSRVATSVPCDIQMIGTSQVMRHGRIMIVRRMKGYFHRDLDIRNRDQVVWNSLTLNVRGTPMLEVDQAQHIVAELEEVT